MRKCLLAGLAVVLMMAGVLIALRRPIHCPVTQEVFERIKKGTNREGFENWMTLAEVEGIFRLPPITTM